MSTEPTNEVAAEAAPCIEIRTMVPEDYPQVFALWEHINGFALRNVDDSEEGITRFLHRNPTTSVVAEMTEADGSKCIVGTILCGHDGRQACLYHVCVAHDFRKHGIGRRMVQAALKAVNAEGISKCTLVAFASNAVGNAFWERIGWEPRPDLNSYEFRLNAENVIRYVENAE